MTEAISWSAPAAAWLEAGTRERLIERLELALCASRASGSPTIVSVTSRCARATDPTALIAASRRPAEPWFCFEQPDRDGSALAALGSVRRLEGGGEDRFGDLAARWGKLVARAVADEPAGPPGSGLVALGGFAFAPDGGGTPAWDGFAPASLLVPEVSLVRKASEVWLTVNVELAPDDTVADAIGRVERRLSELRERQLPLLDPAPTGPYKVVSPMPPSHYEEAVARAVQRIRAGELEKVVLAREVEVHAPLDHDPEAVLGLLRDAFPSCFVFAVGRGEATFLAASPELLVRREGQRASTVALAGSIRRSADPAVDDHLGEQLLRSDKDREENAIVARRIARVLSTARGLDHRRARARARPGRQHPAPRHADPRPAGRTDRCGRAGGAAASDAGRRRRAREIAGKLIPALEGFDRGWYASPVGWTDAVGDGEFCVALRCALLRGSLARCYAGCGIVRDSDPAAELAETEVKLQALLPVLAG